MPINAKYSFARIALHWLMLLLLVAVYASMEFRDLYPKGSEARELLKTWHYMLGLSVLAWVALRLLARWLQPGPPPEPGPPWQMALARAMHLGLYGFMVAMPLLGWLTLSAAGKPVPFFGLELPALLAANKDLSHQLKEVHEALATAGYFLVGLHALGALFHHYVVKDDTLRRMGWRG
ncbi:MAG: cytochrome b [Polaromonas sp.]